MTEPPWLTLVGLGEDGLDGLAAPARHAIAGAALVVGGRRHLALVGKTGGEQIPWASPIEDTFARIAAQRGRPVCVLATGDPFFYGVGSVLARTVPPAEMRCFPQPSAFSLVAARLGWGLQDCTLLSLHGRPLERIIPHLRPDARLIVLSWDGHTPAALARLLDARGFGRSRLTVCEALGGPREKVTLAVAADVDRPDVLALNSVAVEVRCEARARARPLTPGLPDGWFEHDGQITKSRVRALTLAALAPQPGTLLWDVGAGSGSVGIEWMALHPGNRAIAIERDASRCARIARNAASLGVPDIRVVEGAAPGALEGLATPDAIFIGGGLTGDGLLGLCRAALRPGGRLVANAVTLESQGLLASAHASHGGDLASLSLAQAVPVGRFHGWQAAMPVVQWVWSKP